MQRKNIAVPDGLGTMWHSREREQEWDHGLVQPGCVCVCVSQLISGARYGLTETLHCLAIYTGDTLTDVDTVNKIKCI